MSMKNYICVKITRTPRKTFIFRAAAAKPYVTPSPGAYEAADTNRYKNKSPSFSLSTRYTVPSDHTMKPGPGAYSPEKVTNQPTNPSVR